VLKKAGADVALFGCFVYEIILCVLRTATVNNFSSVNEIEIIISCSENLSSCSCKC